MAYLLRSIRNSNKHFSQHTLNRCCAAYLTSIINKRKKGHSLCTHLLSNIYVPLYTFFCINVQEKCYCCVRSCEIDFVRTQCSVTETARFSIFVT